MANNYTKLPPAHNHDAVYVKIGEGGVTDHGALSGLADNDHPQYLLTTGKAADSDKLDGIDSTGFVNTTGTQTVAGVKTFSSIPVLPATDPTTENQAVRKGFADGAYLGISAKAADADKLDGNDSTYFQQNLLDSLTIELGYNRPTDASAYIDFHTIADKKDYDARICALNGTKLSGKADVQYIAAKHMFTGSVEDNSGNEYGRPVFRTSPLTSTNWAGGSKTSADNGTINLNSEFGVPAGVKAVLLGMQIIGATAGHFFRVGPSSTYNYAIYARMQVANVWNTAYGICPCDSSGNIYAYVSGTISQAYIWIWGYWL